MTKWRVEVKAKLGRLALLFRRRDKVVDGEVRELEDLLVRAYAVILELVAQVGTVAANELVLQNELAAQRKPFSKSDCDRAIEQMRWQIHVAHLDAAGDDLLATLRPGEVHA